MKIDTDILVQQLRNKAQIHSVMVQSARQNAMVPSPDYDITASRVLRAIADAIMMATDDTEQI